MSTVTQVVNSPASAVWKVIADGWLYSGWVVGASRIRSVDGHWPEVGAQLHHSVGAWPLLINDSTKVTAADPGRQLEMIARGWPIGEAKVIITLEDLGGQCRVTIDRGRGPRSRPRGAQGPPRSDHHGAEPGNPAAPRAHGRRRRWSLEATRVT